MIADLMDTARIDREWDAMTEKLAAALKHGPEYDLGSLYERLLDGQAWAFEMRDGADGLWIVSVAPDLSEAWTVAIAGKLQGGPKKRLASMRFAVECMERALMAAGIKKHRLCGRSWARILPDYVPIEGVKNGLQKVLT